MHRQAVAIQNAAARLISHPLQQAMFRVNLLRVLLFEGFDCGIPGFNKVLRHLFTDAGDLG